MKRSKKLSILILIVLICLVQSIQAQKGISSKIDISEVTPELNVDGRALSQTSKTWLFEPGPDAFKPGCELDLRFLNEAVAGESGWMIAKDGKLYIPGQKEPFRAWAAGLSPYGSSYSKKDLAYSARIFAKLGINQVREMGRANVSILKSKGDIKTLDPEGLGTVHRLVAAMKREGIYTCYTPWWHVKIADNPEYPGFAKNEAFYWCDDLQQLAKGWYRELLTTVNPETGIPLAQDPALNVIELQNEANLLFGLHPNGCDEARWRQLENRFNAFVQEAGSLQEIVDEWKLSESEREEFTVGSGSDLQLKAVGLGGLMWRCVNKPTPGSLAYGKTYLEFVVYLEREWNGEVARFIKEDLGYKGLILGGDWFSNPRPRMNDLARWGTLPPEGDAVAYHQYSSFFHINPTAPGSAGYAISQGDYYADGSVLARPDYLPTNYKRIKDTPMLVTEIGLPQPNRFALEGQLAAAAYGSLQDHDMIDWLHVMFGDYVGDLNNKFCHNWPHLLGQFPGAALLYRSRFVDEGPVTVSYQKAVASYLDEPAIIEDVLSGDPLYKKTGQKDNLTDPAGKPTTAEGAVDPLAFQVGAVEYTIGSTPSRSVDQGTLDRCIERDAKVVRSATGQLKLNYGEQLLTIDTPEAQGVTGLLGDAGKIELGDLTIECKNNPSAVLVIALDGKPLATSEKILIQAVSNSMLSGSEHIPVPSGTSVEILTKNKKIETITLPDGIMKIETIGKVPFQIESIDAVITFKNRTFKNVVALDLYGYPQGEVAGGSRIVLPENTYFTIIKP